VADFCHFSCLARLLQNTWHPGIVPQDSKNNQVDLSMFALETSNRLFAATFSIVISAAFFAYAIIPASPGLVA